jgi:TPP-dependent 2-oxoacid decarboxylase
MTDAEITSIADKADVILNGYAFTKFGDNIKTLNLDNPECAMVTNADGEVIETNMNDIELAIALDYLHKGIKYMEL